MSEKSGENAGKTILVIDDDKEFQDILRDILKGGGYKVIVAGGGNEGQKLARERKPDMVLVDLNMPDMDGYEVCQAIRADKEIGLVPIILVTVQSQLPDIMRGFKQGADDYVGKPFHPEELLARVNALFRQARKKPS